MKDLYRKFWRQAASPVTVVTTSYASKLAGMTISSLASVSMGPPDLLVSFNCQIPSRTMDVLNQRSELVLNLMSTHPNNILLARAFAGRTSGGPHSNPFDMYSHMFTNEMDTGGIPVVKNATGHLLCEILNTQTAQDHSLVLASVKNIWFTDNEPLVYQNHRFCGLGPNLESLN